MRWSLDGRLGRESDLLIILIKILKIISFKVIYICPVSFSNGRIRNLYWLQAFLFLASEELLVLNLQIVRMQLFRLSNKLLSRTKQSLSYMIIREDDVLIKELLKYFAKYYYINLF